jgi:hypothetical protein
MEDKDFLKLGTLVKPTIRLRNFAASTTLIA